MALPDTLHAEVAGLLATKLRAPSLQQMRVPRQRLTDRLDAGLSRPLTLISAPAGFGKTTLAAQWLAGLRLPVAWISLDEGDNDPVRFWLHVTAALAGAAPDLGAASLGLLKAPDIGGSTPDPSALLNAAASIAGDVVLALDDFHLISSPAIHSALHYCVEHLPERLHLLILTRTDPPFPLARLRARDQLVEIRAGDLQFTLLEAAAFLNDVMHLGLQQDEVRLLADRTEGWIAGLQLAALSIRGRADAGEFITRFTGAHHFVLEYLVEEVLARQSSEVKSFLLRTSILGHLTGALCDAVTGQGDGQMLLRELERSNLFLVPLDDEHRWYRYHHLFADVLRARLEQSDPGLVPHLHEAAARWHEENGLEEDAVRHALAARNFERAARLMERAAVPLMARGEVTTLMAWTESIPAELRRQRPWLAVTHAWGELLTGYPGAVEPILGEIEPDQSPADQADANALLGNMATLRSYVAVLAGDVARTLELARQALVLLPEEQGLIRAVATYLIGRAHTLADDRDQAAVAIEQAIGLARKAGHIYLAASAMCDLAGLELVRGRLGAAGRLYGEAARSAMELGLQVVSALGAAEVGLADVALERNDLAAAERYANAGVEHMLMVREPTDMVIGHLTLARVRQVKGDIAGARAALTTAEHWLHGRDLRPLVRSQAAAVRARLRVAWGEVEGAVEWAAGQSDIYAGSARTPAQMARARVALAMGQPARALQLLAPLAESAVSAGRFGTLMEICTLQALAYQAQGRSAEALGALERALTLAEPEAYVRVFVDGGAPMAAMLREVHRRLTASGQIGLRTYVEQLLEAFPPVQAERTGSLPAPAPSLTDRELEVLRLMAAGLTNEEIGRRLFIALPTVKRHISNLYDKLQVSHRTQALARVRELNLL